MKRKLLLILIISACLAMPQYLKAQVKNVLVKGVVTDKETKETLVGASILLDGIPPKGLTSSNAKGEFSATVPVGATLIFHSVGYKEKKVKITGAETLNVEMVVNSTSLNEVVLRGYVERTKEKTTGSSYTISGSEIQDIPVSNAEELLQGKVPGLNIQVNTGAPGFRGTIAIRGISTISTTGSGSDSFLQPTSPLYIIDGVPIDADNAADFGYNSPGGVSPLELIPTEEIASIEFLKDAQATSEYGSKGAFGVIIITTRRGNSKKPTIRYTANYNVKVPPNLRTTLGGSAERNAKLAEIMTNGSYSDQLKASTSPILSDSLSAYYNNSTNWQAIYYVPTYNTSHNLGIDGGDPTFNYSTNLNYYKEDGIIRNTGFSRYTMSMLMQFHPNDKFKSQVIFSGNLGKRSQGNGQGLLQTGVATNASASSLLPGPSLFQQTSAFAADLSVKNDNSTKNFNTSVQLSYKLLPGLTLANIGSYAYTAAAEETDYPAATNNNTSMVYSYNDRKAVLYNHSDIIYNKSFGGHNFYLHGATEISTNNFQAGYIRLVGTANDQILGPLGYNTHDTNGGGVLKSFHDYRSISYSGAFTYDYKTKYVLDLSYRLDGSSISGFDSPYAKNRAVGFKWNFYKESFLKDLGWLSSGDIRLSYGQNIQPTGNIYSLYGEYAQTGIYEGSNRIQLVNTNIPNNVLKSTTNTTYNFGLDVNLFNNKVSINFDTYLKQVTNMQSSVPLSTMTGFGNVLSNDASLIDYGYELSLTMRPLPATSKLVWSLTFIGAINRDYLTQLPGNKNQIVVPPTGSGVGTTVLRVGRNTLSNYILKYNGVYSTTANVPVDPATGLPLRTSASSTAFFKAGDPIWQDTNGDYVIDDNDRQVLGNSQPIVTGGLNTYLKYKSFTLNINGSFTYKRDIMNDALATRLRLVNNPFGSSVYLPLTDLNYWKQPGDQASYPNPYDYNRTSAINPFRSEQSLFMASGSYFKVNNITLGYTFNKKLLDKLGIANLRLTCSANNVITFSPYIGPNPENVSALGYDQSGGYPVSRTYNIGLNLQF